MSVVDFNERAAKTASRDIGPLVHGEPDGMLAPLSQDERRDVRDMLDLIARKLAGRSTIPGGMRRRLDAVVANLIAAADTIDGDADLEDGADAEQLTATETAGRGFQFTPTAGHDDDEDEDEDDKMEHGLPDDNGLGDAEGLEEQGFSGLPERLHLIQAARIAQPDRG